LLTAIIQEKSYLLINLISKRLLGTLFNHVSFGPFPSQIEAFSRLKTAQNVKLMFKNEPKMATLHFGSPSTSPMCYLMTLGLIPPTFYAQLLPAQIPKAQKIQPSCQSFCAFWISMRKSVV